MQLIYENKKYIFENKWISEDGKEVTEILSNFLSKRAIEEGADPCTFSSIMTSVKSRSKKVSVSKKEKKKTSGSRGIKMIFSL